MLRTDVHQHLWPEPVVAALAARDIAPRLRLSDGRWRLDLPGEESCLMPGLPEDVSERAALVAADDLDRALVSLSPALGLEGLPGDEAALITGAFAAALGEQSTLGRWATTSLREPDLSVLDGAAGLCLPAGAFATPAGVLRAGPVLEALEATGKPLFIHPGPDPYAPRRAIAEPAWWASMTDYLTAMHTAWFSWLVAGCGGFPTLNVVFALLAGGAPLQLDRLRGRAPACVADAAQRSTRMFYETSSSGPAIIDAVASVVGTRQLVFGSDRPVVVPGAVPAADALGLTQVNPARLLGEVVA